MVQQQIEPGSTVQLPEGWNATFDPDLQAYYFGQETDPNSTATWLAPDLNKGQPKADAVAEGNHQSSSGVNGSTTVQGQEGCVGRCEPQGPGTEKRAEQYKEDTTAQELAHRDHQPDGQKGDPQWGVAGGGAGKAEYQPGYGDQRWMSAYGDQPAYRDDDDDDEYVEWRRNLTWDDIAGYPSDRDTFLRLCAQLGLYTNEWDVSEEGDKCELSLWRTRYGGTLTFYADKHGKISIGQSNLQKKKAIWWLLEPWTTECQERPSKRKRGKKRGSGKGKGKGASRIPSPAQLLRGAA